MKPILIVTSTPDPHADAVSRILSDLDQPIVRFNTDTFSPDSYLGFASPNHQIYLYIDSKPYLPSDFHSIWYRKPELWLNNQLPLQSVAGLKHKYRKSEIMLLTKQFILSAENSGTHIISKPSKIEYARNKLLQLSLAGTLGFHTPTTLVSSSPLEIEKFLRKHPDSIIKTLGTAYVEFGRKQMSFFTHRFTLDHFLKTKDSTLYNQPIFIQENVAKKYELRVTLVGNQTFACAIDSQSDPDSLVDWRQVDPERIKHTITKLPQNIDILCHQLRTSLGLEYSAIDLAVDPHNNYVFFEINPNGQYLWIEEQTGLPISNAIANALIHQQLD